MSTFEGLKRSLSNFANDVVSSVQQTTSDTKSAFEKFEIVCPVCNLVQIAPESADTHPTFKCGNANCKTLLLTPSKTTRGLFISERMVDKVSGQIEKAIGPKSYQLVKVTVPDGVEENQIVEIEFKKVKYRVTIPKGKLPGDVFEVNLDVTENWKLTHKKLYLAKKAIADEDNEDVNVVQATVINDKAATKDAKMRADDFYKDQI